MPGPRDKIIINGMEFEGSAAAMTAAFKAAGFIATEIENGGLIKEAHKAGFTKKQERVCEELDKALEKALANQRALTNEMRLWLDDKLGLNLP